MDDREFYFSTDALLRCCWGQNDESNNEMVKIFMDQKDERIAQF